METIDLREFAEKRGFKWINTTENGTGYPKNLKGAVVGFNSFEDAQQLATMYGLEVERFEKKEGWSLWWRTGNWADAPFKIGADLFGDDYSEYFAGEEDLFFENDVKNKLEEVANVEELFNLSKWSTSINDQIEALSDDEVIILHPDKNEVVYKVEQMEYSYDSRTYIIGLIEK